MEKQRIKREYERSLAEHELSGRSGMDFVSRFSERILEELKEFSDGCKKGAVKIKKLIVKLEEFYTRMRNGNGSLPLAPTIKGGDAMAEHQN